MLARALRAMTVFEDGSIDDAGLEAALEEIVPILRYAYAAAAQAAVRQIARERIGKARPRPETARLIGRFNETNPKAVEWARTTAATRVTAVGSETKAAIRDYTAAAFERGIPPRLLARQLRAVVGVTPRQGRTLLAHYDAWKAAGLSDEAAAHRLIREARRALKIRTEMIARTETLYASNAGQVDAWREARGDGLIDPDLVKSWITTPDDRLCVLCEPLDGLQAEIDEAFAIEGFAGILQPPLHPQCRCAVGLVARERSR
jgi:hypothetical protein